jgi:hypothetical protein
MSFDPDRIAVPTNGKRPHPVAEAVAQQPPPRPAAAPEAAPAVRDLPGGLSPQQLAVGFGIVASLLALAAGLARRRVRR